MFPAATIGPVAHELLVKAGLVVAGFILVERPEARRVGREDFVDEDEFPRGIQAPLELRIGDDDASMEGVLRCLHVQVDAGVAQP